MKRLDPFKADFDYRYAYPVLHLTFKERLYTELEADHFFEADRAGLITSILGLIRIELPSIFVKSVNCDVETAYCFAQNIFDKITALLQGWPISCLTQVNFEIPRNHLLTIYSKETLSLFWSILLRGVMDIKANLDESTEQVDKMIQIDRHYGQLACHYIEDFTSPWYRSKEMTYLVARTISPLFEDI